MAKSVKAVLSAIALLTVNAAWCQSYSPYAASKGGNQLEAVPISKVKFKDAVIAGFRMAFAREIVWPRYAYEISPFSDDLVNTCQLLEQIDQDVVILMSEFDLDAQNSSGEVKGYVLEPSRVCEFKKRRSSGIDQLARYAYKINLYPDDFFGICMHLEQYWNDKAVRMINFNLYAQTSGRVVKSEEFNLWDGCNLDLDLVVNYFLNDYDNYYLVTEGPVPFLEFDPLIWPDNEIWPNNDYTNYYLVTERPVPSLNLNTRVWLGDEPNYSVAILN